MTQIYTATDIELASPSNGGNYRYPDTHFCIANYLQHLHQILQARNDTTHCSTA